MARCASADRRINQWVLVTKRSYRARAFMRTLASSDGLHIGGGITADNAQTWLDAGAEKIIVTSYLFPGAKFDLDRLRDLANKVGKERLVVDVR